jgi:hypothetical protein
LRTESVEKWSPDFKSSIHSHFKYYKFIVYSSSCCISCMERKKDLSHLMIKTYFFYSLTGSSYSLLLCCPPTPSPLPSSSRRSPASSPNEPIHHVLYVSGLRSKITSEYKDVCLNTHLTSPHRSQSRLPFENKFGVS